MSNKTKFRWKNSTLKNRIKRDKPVWLWKWTVDAYHKYKENKKKGIIE